MKFFLKDFSFMLHLPFLLTFFSLFFATSSNCQITPKKMTQGETFNLPSTNDTLLNAQESSCPIVLFIEPLAGICLDSTLTPFGLTVTIQGSDGSGFGVWGGAGIIDSGNGVFDPLDPLVSIGNNVVTFTFVENGCVIEETTTIILNLPPDASFTADPTICSNSFSNIFSSNGNGDNYDWDFNSGQIITGTDQGPFQVSWGFENTYTVSLTVSQNGCTSTEFQTIEVKAPLDAPIIDCNSTTSEISFNWGDVQGALDYEVLVINGQAGIEAQNIYTVSNLLSGGDSVTIQLSAVGPPPCGNSVTTKTCYTNDCPPINIIIEPVQNICLYPNVSNLELVAYLENLDLPGIWSGNGIIDPDLGIFDPNHSLVVNGSNTVYVSFSEDVCEYRDSIIINVFETPTADAGLTDELTCINAAVALSGSASGDNLRFAWNGSGIVSGINSLSPVVDQSGLFRLKVIDTISACFATDSVIVTIDHSVPMANAGNDKEITCDSASVVLQGGGSVGPIYQFVWHGPGINLSNLHSQNPEVSIPGQYILEVYDVFNQCYSPKDSVFVEDKTNAPIAKVTQQIDPLNCEVLNNQLIGNTIPNGSYQWLDANNQIVGNTNLFTASFPGYYTYKITNTLTGCVGFETVFVSKNVPYPDAEVTVSEILDCDTKEVVLNGSGSFFGSNVIYLWSGPTGGIVSGLNSNIITVVLPGDYTLNVLDTISNCSAEITKSVIKIANSPTAVVNDPGEIDCNLQEIELEGSGSSGLENISYQWVYDSIVIGQDSVTTVSNSGTYELIVSNINSNCSDTATVEIIYEEAPIKNVGVGVLPPSCFGENDGIVIFDSIIGGTPSFTFSIDGGQNFSNYNQFYNIQSGLFDLVILDANGCQWDTIIEIDNPVDLKLSIGNNMFVQMGDTLLLTAEFNIPEDQVDTIIWYPTNIINCIEAGACFEVVGRPLNSFYARATLIDLNGCIVKDRIKIEIDKESIAYVPNIFSPNGDNKNDKFTIYAGKSVKRIKHFSIYNRWGKTIYEGTDFLPNDPDYGWDGTLDGKLLNPAVFVYWAEVELIDGQKTIFKGEVTLIK